MVTGVLESMERDDAKSLIERYGGKVTGNVSKKTTYLVRGRDSGVSKLEKVTNSDNLLQTKLKDSDQEKHFLQDFIIIWTLMYWVTV